MLDFAKMNALILLGLLAVAQSMPEYDIEGGIQYLWFNQTLDHFNASDVRTFKQQYQVFDDFFKPGGPLLLLVGPERGIYPFEISVSAVVMHAYEMGGLIVATEHRYYGKSLPFGADSFTVPAMRWLTVANALADNIAIATNVSQYYPTNGTFSFGGSYGGYLSASLRVRYPEIITGSIASAAPVYLPGSGLAVNTWYDKVSETYEKTSSKCAAGIEAAFKTLYNDAVITPQNLPQLASNLRLCSVPTSSSIGLLTNFLKNCFSQIVEFNYPTKDVFCEGWPLNQTCSIFEANTSSYPAVLSALQMCYNTTSANVQCFPYDTPFKLPGGCTKHARQASRTTPIDPWAYQTCTEFVMPVAGTGIFSFPSPWHEDSIQKYCQTKFPGAPWNPLPPLLLVNQTSVNFTNVVFSNGEFDPVRGFSPSIDLGPSVIALNIEGSAHTYDLIDLQHFKFDPASVKKARWQELQILQSWLPKQ